MPKKIELINGGSFTDSRGTLQFVNDFTFKEVKRFYQIIHTDTNVIRAWQGHKIEHKFFYAAAGSFLIACVEIDNWEQPSLNLDAKQIVLTSQKPAVLSVPPGYANGIKALTPHSILTVYSNLTLAQSKEDRWSFDCSLWFDWSKI